MAEVNHNAWVHLGGCLLRLYAVGGSQHPLLVEQGASARVEACDGGAADVQAGQPGPAPLG